MYLMYFGLMNPSWGRREEDGTRTPYPPITYGVQICSCSAKATQLIASVVGAGDGTKIQYLQVRDALEAVGGQVQASYDEYTRLLWDVLAVVRKLGTFPVGSSMYSFYNHHSPAEDAYHVYLGWQLWRQWSQVSMWTSRLLLACRNTSREQRLLYVLQFLWNRASGVIGGGEAAYYHSALALVRTMTSPPKKYGESIISPDTDHYHARVCSNFVPGTPKNKDKAEAQRVVAAWASAAGIDYTPADAEVLKAAKVLLPPKQRQEEW